MKGRDEGLEMERIEEKESDNKITEIVEKEIEPNNEEFTKRVPVNKDNNEEEIVSEMPEHKRLIEDNLERRENEVNKSDISEDGNNENEVPNEELIDEEIEVPRDMSKSVENKTIIEKEYLSKNENNWN